MTRFAAALVVGAALAVAACDCGPTGAGQRRYACTGDDQCAEGFTCVLGECRDPGDGTDAGHLAFATSPQILEAAACSQRVAVEARSGGGDPWVVAADTPVGLAASPDGGFGFFSDPACSVRASSATILRGESAAGFYFRGTAAGPVEVTAAAAGLGSATQTETIDPGPPARLEISTGPQTVLARACSQAVTLTFRDAQGNAAPVAAGTSVPLAVAPAGGPGLFSDASCTTATAAASFPAGASSASFFFRGLTGGTFAVTASPSGMPPVSQSEVILPTVRRGTCAIAAGTAGVTCSISPAQLDLGRTFMLFQAVVGGADTPSAANVRCRLASTSTIECSRAGAIAIVANIAWQTVELPTGLKVQHVDAACGASNVVSVPIAAVATTAETFVLASHEEAGAFQDDDDMAMVELSSTTNVNLTLTTTCSWTISLQVIEMSGISVTPGRAQIAAGADAGSAAGLPPAGTGSTVLLHSHQVPASAGEICDRLIRGEVDGDASLRFTRGNGNAAAGCYVPDIDLAYQRIDFGPRATVQRLAASMAPAVLTADLPIAAVDQTRSFVLSGGQVVSGQSMGETSYTANDVIGEAAALHQLTTSTNLRLTRGSANASARWSTFVVQLE